MVNVELWNSIRKQKKITLDDLSKSTGISISTLKDIFRGKTTSPRLDTVEAIERALGLNEKPQPNRELREDEKELIYLVSQLTSDEVKEMSNYLDFIISRRTKQ